MTQQSTEDRLAALEKEVVELKRKLTERLSFEELRTDVKELRTRYQAHEEYVSGRLNDFESHINVRLDVAEDNNAARFQELQSGITDLAGQVQGLAAGQQQIIEMLQGGKPKTQA